MPFFLAHSSAQEEHKKTTAGRISYYAKAGTEYTSNKLAKETSALLFTCPFVGSQRSMWPFCPYRASERPVIQSFYTMNLY
ncbi:MAG: hypothetical protein Q7K34_00340 [archaeon]|nr:hypothetical protein [archaeon]